MEQIITRIILSSLPATLRLGSGRGQNIESQLCFDYVFKRQVVCKASSAGYSPKGLIMLSADSVVLHFDLVPHTVTILCIDALV